MVKRKKLVRARLLLLAVLPWVLGSAASHASPACVAGSLSFYISLGATGCTVADELFSSFGYDPVSGNSPAAANIGITPVGSNTLDPGLLFHAVWLENISGSMDSAINFAVTETSPSLLIDGASLQIAAIDRGSVSGTVTATFEPVNVTLTADLTHQFVPGSFVPPVGLVTGTDSIVISSTGGLVSLSQITERFSETSGSNQQQAPEPSLVWLVGAALASIAGVRFVHRRR